MKYIFQEKKRFLHRNPNIVKHSQSLYQQLGQNPTAAHQDVVNRRILYTTTEPRNMYKLQLQPIPASTTENFLQILLISLSHQGIPTLDQIPRRSLKAGATFHYAALSPQLLKNPSASRMLDLKQNPSIFYVNGRVEPSDAARSAEFDSKL